MQNGQRHTVGRVLRQVLILSSDPHNPGDLLYTQILGQHIIVINSVKLAVELLEKRSRKYSDRPALSTIKL